MYICMNTVIIITSRCNHEIEVQDDTTGLVTPNKHIDLHNVALLNSLNIIEERCYV